MSAEGVRGLEWLDWARQLAAVAQNGLHYATDQFDVVRYSQVREIASAMLAKGGAGRIGDVLAVLEREQGYTTPKVDVRGVAFHDDRVLLVRELTDGRWTLPGGWADPTEVPSAAVEREIAEEAGYRARAIRLLACWDRTRQEGAQPYPFRVYKLFFDCRILGSTQRDESETDAVGWFPVHDPPPLSLGRVTPGQLTHLYALHRDPLSPAAFH
ncbi:MAG: NUDIX domain-containing protein [Nitriliruptorales bacterium]|nr:NUDIX domain-containing protein [Nitriliruptorales bacterium]